MISIISTALDNDDDRTFMLWLYQEFKHIMLSTVKKYIANPQDQEDIIQDSILKLIKKIDLLREKERCVLGAYVVYTVRNTATNHLRHTAVEKAHFESFDDGVEYEADLLPLDDLMALKERNVQVVDAIKRLSDGEQALLIGKYVLEYSDDELGDQLGCKPASIRMKLTRARRKALELLIKDEDIDYDKT